MRYFDLHCDTLYRATIDNSNLCNDEYHINKNCIPNFDIYIQFMAMWIPDSVKGQERTNLFLDGINKYKNNRIYNEKIKMYLSAENASMLNGNINNFTYLIENDVKTITLTWNDDNELGSGALSNSNFGLTTFGRDVVRLLNEYSIPIDVSHASDKLFYDIIKYSNDRILATHSNSRTVTNCPRNLSDDMFKEIACRNGLVGLNFYNGFLNDNPNVASIDDLLRHADYFLNIGGENVLAIGSDFDGADMPIGISGISDIPKIYNVFCDEFGQKITDKIFFENAVNFFSFFD